MYGQRVETIMCILSECEKLVPEEYKKDVAAIIHWELCNMYGFRI